MYLHPDIVLSTVLPKLLVEGVHGLSRVKALLIERIIKCRDSNYSTCYDQLFREVLGEVLGVECLAIDSCWHFGSPRQRASHTVRYRSQQRLLSGNYILILLTMA